MPVFCRILNGDDPAANSANRMLTYDKMTDEAVWEGKLIRRSDPISE